MNPTWKPAWFHGSPGTAIGEALARVAVALVGDALVADPLVADPPVAEPPDAAEVEPQADSTAAATSTPTPLNSGPRAPWKRVDIQPSNEVVAAGAALPHPDRLAVLDR
jgi:hypothetical protein